MKVNLLQGSQERNTKQSIYKSHGHIKMIVSMVITIEKKYAFDNFSNEYMNLIIQCYHHAPSSVHYFRDFSVI